MAFKPKDHYYNKAKQNSFLARSVFKLEEIDKKFKLIKKNMIILDLGYHPGSWIQYASPKVKPNGHVYGVDLKKINKKISQLPNVTLFEMDFFQFEFVGEDKFDVILSDMAPNTTGVKSVDQENSLNLIRKVFEILPQKLKENGHLVIKVFDSHEAQSFLKSQKKLFKHFSYFKPQSTRTSSKEFFVVGREYQDSFPSQ